MTVEKRAKQLIKTFYLTHKYEKFAILGAIQCVKEILKLKDAYSVAIEQHYKKVLKALKETLKNHYEISN